MTKRCLILKHLPLPPEILNIIESFLIHTFVRKMRVASLLYDHLDRTTWLQTTIRRTNKVVIYTSRRTPKTNVVVHMDLKNNIVKRAHVLGTQFFPATFTLDDLIEYL
jgi:hypothetical protein